MRLFRSFQIFQCTRMEMVSKSRRKFFGALRLASSHHSSVLRNASLGVAKSALDQTRILFQICCENLQCTNRCVQSSSACWQREQIELCGHPLLAKLSAVRHRLWTTSHMKNLHFIGALDFQIGLAHAKRVLAMKKRLYAELTEKTPFDVHRQTASSLCPAVRTQNNSLHHVPEMKVLGDRRR